MRRRKFEKQWGHIDRQLRELRKPWHFPHMPVDSRPFDPKDF